MGMDDVANHWFDRRGGKLMNCQSSGQYMHSQLEQVGDTAVNSMAACKEVPSSVANPCYSGSIANRLLASNWNPLVSMPEHVDFIGSTASSYGADTQGNQRVSSPGVRLIDQIQSRLCFSSENFSEMVNYFALSEDFQSTGALGPTGFPASDEHGIEKDYSKEKKRNIQELAASDSQSKFHMTQTSEAEHKESVLPEPTKSAKEKDVKKPKIEQNTGIKTHKLTSKEEKENSSNADAPKEDYIHVRAKRGQATNSHSLAERLRREKISERMKFLQDLIPGCSKITGKAVMLDEIINYVQSLQQQVEFLSMKLATVSPELNYDVEQILSKDIFLPQSRGSALLQFGPGFSTPYHQFQQPIPQGVTQFEVGSNPNLEEMGKHTLTRICPVAQITNVWDADLQSESVMRMGFIPNAHLDASIDLAGSTMIDQ